MKCDLNKKLKLFNKTKGYMYLTDNRGDINKPIVGIDSDLSIEKLNVKCIGYNSGNNEYSVDLMQNMLPSDFSIVLINTFNQLSARVDIDDDFWCCTNEMLLESFAIIAKANGLINNGAYSIVLLPNGVVCKSYSLYHINYLMADDVYLKNCINTISNQLIMNYIGFNPQKDDVTISKVFDAILYILNKWLFDGTGEIKSGFEASMKNLMMKLIDDTDSLPFTTGVAKNTNVLELSEILEGFYFVNLPKNNNSSALIIDEFLKARIFCGV